jgi:tripartite-type tricarboxylate transporter receptor subunit TctC
MNIVRRFGSLCILSMLIAATGALAQAWPSKPVTLVATVD